MKLFLEKLNLNYNTMREKIEKLIEELENNKYVEITHCLVGKPIESELINMLLSMYKIDKIPDALFDFYQEMGIVEINWEYDLTKKGIKLFQEGESIISGTIKVFPVESLLMTYDNLRTENFTEDELKDVENFRVFDYNDDDITFGLFKSENRIEEDLYYVKQEADGFSKPKINLQQYFDKMIESKGFFGWQYNMLFPETQSNERMKHYLNQLFKN